MPSVFVGLALANVILLIGTAAIGFLAPALGADRHILLAVLTLVLSCFAQVAAFTVLTVTGKIMSQAVHLGRLDQAILDRVRAIKKTFTRCLALAFVPMVIVTATGASLWRSAGDTTWHYLSAGLLVAVHGFVYWREYELMVRNARLARETLESYSRAREKRAEGGGVHRPETADAPR